MTRKEAREFLTDISYKLGNMSVEYLSEKDGEKMREAIKALEQESCDDIVNWKLGELFERVENIEKQIKEDKEEQLKKLKAEVDYAKFRCALPTIIEAYKG